MTELCCVDYGRVKLHYCRELTTESGSSCCSESSMCNFIVADAGRCQDAAALRWEALSIFLENVMSRALTSEKATNATEAGVLLLKQLLLFSSPVSGYIISTMLCLLILITMLH